MTDLYKGASIIALVLLVIGGAAFAGYYFTKPKPVVETYKPEVKQPDGSIIVERKPDAKAKPRVIVPKKAVVERVGSATIQGATPVPKAGMVCEKCPPVTIDTALIRNQDGTKSLIIKSDGIILRAVDIPVENALAPTEPKKWAAGMSYSIPMQTPGIWIDRDIMRVRLGAELNQTRIMAGGQTGTEIRLRLGVTF